MKPGYEEEKQKILDELDSLERQNTPKIIKTEADFDSIFGKDRVPNGPLTEEQKSKKREKKTYEYYKKNVFDVCYPITRFCPIKKDLYVRTNYGKWVTASSREKSLRSVSSDQGLAPGLVGDHLPRWVSRETNMGCEEKLLVDIPEWDGVKRLDLFLDSLVVGNMQKEHARELFKQYMVNMWKRIHNKVSRNWVLVLNGDQEAGKDRWIEQLMGGWDDEHYFENLNVFSDEIRTFSHLKGKIVLHVAEFDDTKKWTPGFLKDLITKKNLSFIGKYEKEATFSECHHSLIASSNKLDFLNDETGSNRFLIFDIPKGVKIEPKYPHGQSLQCIAEARVLHDRGFKASSAALKSLGFEQARLTPICGDDVIISEFKDILQALENDAARRAGCSVEELSYVAKRFTNEQLESTWKTLGDRHRKSKLQIMRIVKPIFGDRSKSGRFYAIVAN